MGAVVYHEIDHCRAIPHTTVTTLEAQCERLTDRSVLTCSQRKQAPPCHFLC